MRMRLTARGWPASAVLLAAWGVLAATTGSRVFEDLGAPCFHAGTDTLLHVAGVIGVLAIVSYAYFRASVRDGLKQSGFVALAFSDLARLILLAWTFVQASGLGDAMTCGCLDPHHTPSYCRF